MDPKYVKHMTKNKTKIINLIVMKQKRIIIDNTMILQMMTFPYQITRVYLALLQMFHYVHRFI